MVRRVVANARRSQLVSTYGVGALFPAEDQSLMICGLDEWPEDERSTIDEPRLAASLGVTDFRMPASGRRRGDVPTVRFPEMHFCVQCRALKPRWQFCADDRSTCRDCGAPINADGDGCSDCGCEWECHGLGCTVGATWAQVGSTPCVSRHEESPRVSLTS